MFKEIETIVIENRSIAENDPKNLLKFSECKKLFELIGETAFIEFINRILDLTE